MERKQFTFYRSYRDALRKLKKMDRLALYDALIDYGLDGEVKTPLNDQQQAFFQLMEPSLTSGRRKALAAYSAYSIMQDCYSKVTANEQQTDS